jgi:hypothetical protein
VAERAGEVRLHVDVARRRLEMMRAASVPIAFIGLDGGGNLGDDALRNFAQRQLGDVRLEPLMPAHLERRLARVRLAGARYFSHGLLGGGTLISSSELPRVRAAVDAGIRMWAIGTGAGSSGFEMTYDVDISGWRPVLLRFDYLGVRGPRSAARLAELGVESDVVGDLALGLSVGRTLSPVLEPATIAVNLGGSPGAVAERSHEASIVVAVASALRPFVAAGWRVLLFAMAPGDVPVLERLCAAMSLSEPVLVPHDADRLIETLASCRLTLAMRLHAAILSCCAGVPPLVVAYRDKCADFMETMGMSEWMLDPRSPLLSALGARLDDLKAQADSLRERLLARAQALGAVSCARLAQLRAASHDPHADDHRHRGVPGAKPLRR